MYTYPEYLNACQRIALDLLERAHERDPVRFPFPLTKITCTVAADSLTGTASVSWRVDWGRLYVTINMPVKAASYMVTEAEFQHGIAYLLHEVGHPLHTCKVTWDAAVASKRHNLLNSLEDVREERATIDLELAINARLMFGSLIDSLHAKAVANGYNPNDVRSIGWTLSLMGRMANGYDMDVSDVHQKLDAKGTVAGIMGWALPDLAACQSTQDCLDLADRVTAAVRAANKPKPQPVPEPEAPPELPDVDLEDLFDESLPEDMEGEGDDMPEGWGESDVPEIDQEFEPQGVEKAEPKGKAEDEGTVDANTGPSRQNDIDPDAEEEPEQEPEPEFPEPEPEPEAPADELFDKSDLTPNRNEVVTSSSKTYGATREVIRQVRRAIEHPKGDKPVAGRAMRYGYSGLTTVDIVTGDASKMGRQRSLLAQALKREELDDYEGGRLHGRLDRRSMARLVIGNPHVFGKRTVTEGYDTDVQILVDGSTSMDNSRILAAATLGLVVAQAAAQVGVECTAHVFNDNGLHAIAKGRAKPIGRRFAYAYNQVMGCTPLTENLLACAFEQKRRAPGKRRIMFLITDGGCDLGPDVLKAAGQYVEGVIGAEIANLHIGYQPMGIFRNECAVNVDNVPASGLQTLTGVLERGLRS